MSLAVCQVIGMYDYNAQNDDELAFNKGQIITVLNKEDPDWWKGEVNGHVGLFPSNYVKLTTDTDPSQQCECPAARRGPRRWNMQHCPAPLPPGSLKTFCPRCVWLVSFPSPVARFPPPPHPSVLLHASPRLPHFPSLNLLIVLFCLCVVFLLFLGIICCPSPTQA